MIKKILFKNPLASLITILLWLTVFFDSYSDNLWNNAILATSRVACIVGAYQVYLFYYPKLEMKKSARIKFIAWFIALGLSMFLVEGVSYSIEDQDQDNEEEMLLDKDLYFKEGNSYVLFHEKQIPLEDEEMPLIIAEIIFALVFSFIIIVVAMVFARSTVLSRKNKQNELDIARLTALNKESELNELKNQLNPHFLFNALSNIYSIAYLGDKETPDKIMNLSKMLRYVIYDTNVKSIGLSKEVEYLLYYIEFQKFKIKKEQQIEFHFDGYNADFKIAPLILLPFVENAFKHSQVASEPGAWVRINLQTTRNHVLFLVENTISKQNAPEILNNTGIGLENIQKRLKLIYKDQYELIITQNEYFNIQLKIAIQ